MQSNASNGRLYIPALAEQVDADGWPFYADGPDAFYAVLGFVTRRAEHGDAGPDAARVSMTLVSLN